MHEALGGLDPCLIQEGTRSLEDPLQALAAYAGLTAQSVPSDSRGRRPPREKEASPRGNRSGRRAAPPEQGRGGAPARPSSLGASPCAGRSPKGRRTSATGRAVSGPAVPLPRTGATGRRPRL